MDTNELIAQYFLNALSPEAQKEFDHLMATDPEFAKEVSFQKNLKTVIRKEEQIRVKNKLRSFESEHHGHSKTYLKWLVAASIVGLLAVTSFIYFGQAEVNNEALFVANFEPYKNVIHPIVRGQDSVDLKTKAFIAYKGKHYEEALAHFNAILDNHVDPEILFYKSNVLLQLGKYKDAVDILSKNKALPSRLRDQQQWYLALAYLQVDNDMAISTLKALISKGDYKKEAAQKLLEQLD